MGSKDAEVMKEGITMKKLMTLALAAAMMLGAATGANAIDFKAKGQWIMSFDYGMHGNFGESKAKNNSGFGKHEDEFEARQRVRLQLDAVASEALSGTVFFEMGDQIWGQDSTGGALGADGRVVELKRAYIDWMVPQTDLKVRMGIQGLALPSFTTNASQIFDDDVAAVSLNYQFNENVGLTAFWARPYNDNAGYKSSDAGSTKWDNYMDNMDMFAVLLPLTFDGVKVTPWVMYGMRGENVEVRGEMQPYPVVANDTAVGNTHKAYGSMFWAGLPISLTLWDPLNVELDINYGYVESMGRYDALRYNDLTSRMGSTEREGWLVKALVEYKMDWGTPGIFGWYASGDDGNVKNGSERLPSIAGAGNFTSFMGDGNLAWGTGYNFYDNNLTYAGTWGVGLQLRDVNVIEDLYQTFRVNLIGGTNDPGMAKWLSSQGLAANSGALSGTVGMDGLYLTRQDYALEWGLTSTTKVTENFTVALDVAYVALWLDHDSSVWGNSRMNGRNDEVRDAWNFSLSYMYSF